MARSFLLATLCLSVVVISNGLPVDNETDTALPLAEERSADAAKPIDPTLNWLFAAPAASDKDDKHHKSEADHGKDHGHGVANTTHKEHNNRAAGPPAGAKSGLRICTWNIFRFGPKKFSEPDPFLSKYGKKRIDMMTDQICQAEILALQEFFDPTLVVMDTLIDALNAKCGEWAYVVSDRVGRTSKEQYLFLYKKDVAQVIDSMTYPEPSDIFSREPYFAHFKILKPGFSMKEITLGTIHTEPKKAVEEMNGLVDTYDWAEQEFGTKNVMVLGDYNADCQYVRKSAWDSVTLFTNPAFKWFIPTGVDTASMNSECTFDRAVVKNDAFKNSFVEGSLKVLDFVAENKIEVAQARQLSDHFPVCLLFK